MSNTIHYSHCPSCRSAAISKVFSCSDFTVSGKPFEIWQCSWCTLRFTQNAPDEKHIGPFYQSANYVSHSDTKQGFINRTYHWVRSFTLKSKRSLVKKKTNLSIGNLLDAGAGTGAFAYNMQKAGWNVTGIEPDETAREHAKNNYQLDFLKTNQLLTLEPVSFDAITLWHVLEHVHDLHGYLASFYRILKPGGKLFIAVPNYTSYDAGVYGSCWAAYDVPRHLYHFSPKSMEILLQKNGFMVTEQKPMWFDSFYVSMLSEKIRAKDGFMPRAFWYGLVTDIKTVFDKTACSSLIYVIEKGANAPK